jgi:pimeloyl-ACP methyl ester carboxylesterase
LEVLGGKDEGKGVLKYHELANAGHWLHVDNPVGLRDIIAPELARLHDELRGG